MTNKPSIGVVVHYVSQGHSLGTNSSTCRAAIVTDVREGVNISLAAFSNKGMYFYDGVTRDDGKAAGTWHWPERENGPTSSILPTVKPPKTSA